MRAPAYIAPFTQLVKTSGHTSSYQSRYRGQHIVAQRSLNDPTAVVSEGAHPDEVQEPRSDEDVEVGSRPIPDQDNGVESGGTKDIRAESESTSQSVGLKLVDELAASSGNGGKGKRSRAQSGVIRAADARERLQLLVSKHGKGKALKKGLRTEASKEFTELIASCGRSGLYKLGLDAYEEAVRHIGMDAELGAAAFRAALSAKYFSTVKKIYESASQHGIRFPDNIYSLAVGGLVLCGRLEEGLAMKSKVESRGGKLELFGYNAIIEHHASKGDLRKVLDTLAEVEAVGHKVSHHTESLVLRAVFRTGLGLPGCLDWIEEHGFEVSRAALQAVLEESLSLNDRKGAAEVLELMRKHRKWARVRTYNAFIEHFAASSDIEGAMKTFKALAVANIVPTVQSYFLLALAAVNSGKRLGEVEDMFFQGASEGVQNTYFSYNTRAILAARAGEDVTPIYQEMYDEGFAPDDISFHHAFESMSLRPEKDMVTHALNLLSMMDRMGLIGSRRSMNSLLKVLCRAGAAEQAVELYQSMVTKGVEEETMAPDFETYELALLACGNGKRMDLAVGVFRELEQRNIQPTVALYSTLVMGFGNSRDFESALGVWKEMKEKGLRANRTAYRRMVDACLKHPQGIAHACTTLEEMTAMGFSMDNEYYDTLLKGYGRARELEKVVARFRNINRPGPEVGEVTFGAVLSACNNEESLPTADEAIDRMVSSGIRPTRQMMDYLQNGKSVAKSKNKIMQDVFGPSGVDIVREYLPKQKKKYVEFDALLDGSLSEQVEELSSVEELPAEPDDRKKEIATREKALERPASANKRRLGRKKLNSRQRP